MLVSPYPSSLHAEKCVTLPLVRGPCAEKCWSTPTPRVYMLKSVTLPLEDLVLKSASPPLEFNMLKKCVALPLVIRRHVLQSAGTHV